MVLDMLNAFMASISVSLQYLQYFYFLSVALKPAVSSSGQDLLLFYHPFLLYIDLCLDDSCMCVFVL